MLARVVPMCVNMLLRNARTKTQAKVYQVTYRTRFVDIKFVPTTHGK